MSTETELAWAAGFFDGEGTINKRTFSVSVNQCDPRPLERFRDIFGCGKVLGPYIPKNPNARPYWHLAFHGQNGYRVMVLMWPYLSGPKREQATRCYASVVRWRAVRKAWSAYSKNM